MGKEKRKEKREEGKSADRSKIDIDFGIINLSGIFDLAGKIMDLGLNLKDMETKLYDADLERRAHIESNIRVGGLLGGEPGIRVGSSDFLKRLDELARERRRQRRVPAPSGVTITPRDVVKTELTADIIEREDRVYVLTQVPYERDQIQVSFRKRGEGGELTIEAPGRGYKRLIPINVKVEVPDEVQWSYRNNVVEVVLPKPPEEGKEEKETKTTKNEGETG
ncbi:MAG: Hsp20/alpha crystallin family protein [Candidatus Bathyarchaeia archaeon]